MIRMFELLRRIIPTPILDWYHRTLAGLGAWFYGFPSRKLTVIGVTGTNGKSTVVYLLARILEVAGKKVVASSSIEFQIGEQHWSNKYKMTMPGRFFLQRFLRKAVRAGCTYAVLEVTSEGIAQYRHRFIDFDVAVFLNLSPEHIERHGSYERYRASKGELFRALKIQIPKPKFQINSKTQIPKISIVNLADKEAEYFLQFSADRYMGFRLGSKESSIHGSSTSMDEFVAEDLRTGAGGISFTVRGIEFSSSLLGNINIENLLAATSAAHAIGITIAQCAEAIKVIPEVPGRLEEIPNDRGIRIFVDYAHNPAALESVYQTLKPMTQSANNTKTNMICVLGAAGGGRDKWKRPKLGKLAAKYCSSIILTDEDPYDEDPEKIINEVSQGVGSLQSAAHNLQPSVEKILDRKEAIHKAIKIAKSGDVVVITGKGSEPWMILKNGKKVPWDDRKITREALVDDKPEQE